MKTYKILSVSGAELWSGEASSLADAVVAAVETGVSLCCANLRYVDLSGANLRGARLIDADLRGANLSGANLSGSDLRHADLREADLSGADLRSGANLHGADLRGADMRGARMDPWIIRDWAGNRVFPEREFEDFEAAEEFLSTYLGDTYDDRRGEYFAVPKGM